MAEVKTLSQWRDIIRNVSEMDDDEFGNDVEIIWLDNVPGPGEWALCHGEEVFEDGFEEEDDAIARLEHILKVADMEPIASITMSNTGGVVIYDVADDYILAGINDDVPDYYEVHYELPEDADEDDEDSEYETVFYMGEWRLSLSDAMRLNGGY